MRGIHAMLYVSSFLLADLGQMMPNGKVNLLSAGFNRLQPTSYPFNLQCNLFLVIDGDASDVGNHIVDINLVDGQGKKLGSINCPFTISTNVTTATFLLPLNVAISSQGAYQWDVKIDGKIQSASRPLQAL